MQGAQSSTFEFSFTAMFEFDETAGGYAATFPAIPALEVAGETLQAGSLPPRPPCPATSSA